MWAAAVGVAALVLSLAAVPGWTDPLTRTPASDRSRVAAPVLVWENGCYSEDIQCARVPVPLDYDRPAGRHVSLRLARLPAADPDRRIGTLFVNPGGPGNSGIDFVILAAQEVLSPRLLARFDIVSFDPRGVARSAPIQCFASGTGGDDLFDGLPAFPLSHRQEVRTLLASAAYASACVRHEPVITRHMSTANVARDLDLLRRAVGDGKLTFAGFSYGTYVAATYANMFPSRVRALWVDGVLDPVAWATGRNNGRRVPFSTRLGSGKSSTLTMRAFLRACQDAPDRCAFASADTHRKFNRLVARLKAGPVRGDDGELLFRYGDAIAGMLPPLYFQDAWPELGAQLQALYRLSSPSSVTASSRQLVDRALGPEPNPMNGVDAFNAVACVDTTNPRDPWAWPRAADAADARWAPFGRLWTWESDACAAWAARDTDRFTGPFTARTSAPVLVVGNRLDPATPYAGAVALNRLLPRSRLLTVDYAGHTSLGQSSCVTRHVDRYLIRGLLPPPGAVCESDRQPFEPRSPSAVHITEALRRVLPSPASSDPTW
jgi:pimeloyl-ACP methyl ester carboxylesterase